MSTYDFDCGCKFEVKNDKIKECDGLPSIYIDYNKDLNYNCQSTWALFASGKTKGVFQLEESLGKVWSKRSQPTSIEDISALVALIRPACLNSKLDNKSMTQHYVDRKMGIEEVTYIHPALERILDNTYAIITYQEQAIRIASEIAGFNLQQADSLRKAAGKKDASLMRSLKNTFIDGCKTVGLVNEEQANELFDNIEKSNKYSFNLSHSVAYGQISYWTAYTKVHFPLHFCCSYLHYAREKISPQEEVDAIISDSKNLNVDILTPDIRCLFNGDPGDFAISNMKINFGIRSVKGCGDKNIEKLLEIVKKGEETLQKSIDKWNWTELLFLVLVKVSKTVVNGLISVGGCSHFGLSRQKMLHEYSIASNINEKELALIGIHLDRLGSLEDCLQFLTNSEEVKKVRKEKVLSLIKGLNNPPFSLDDTVSWIAEKERFYLGSPISCIKAETVDVVGNTTCKEFSEGKNAKQMSLVGEIKSMREYILKAGKQAGMKMCFGTLEDVTGRIDFVLSVNKYEELRDIAYGGNIVMLVGKRSKNESLQVERMVTV